MEESSIYSFKDLLVVIVGFGGEHGILAKIFILLSIAVMGICIWDISKNLYKRYKAYEYA